MLRDDRRRRVRDAGEGRDVCALRPSFNPRASRLTRHRRDTVLTARSPRSVEAVTSNKKVISFLVNCGNKNLQYLLVPVRLEAALTAMDTDRDGHIDVDEWETCIEDALKNKLAARAAKRELDAKNAAKEIEEFTNEFLSAARRCFELIDKDGGGTLSTAEIVEAVKSDAEVIDFLKNCGEENLQFLLHPPRLKKALAVLDEDKSGEIDVEECAARRPTCHAIDVHWLMCAQGRRRSRRASRTAWSSCRSNASAATGPTRERTRNFLRSSSARPARFS